MCNSDAPIRYAIKTNLKWIINKKKQKRNVFEAKYSNVKSKKIGNKKDITCYLLKYQ